MTMFKILKDIVGQDTVLDSGLDIRKGDCFSNDRGLMEVTGDEPTRVTLYFRSVSSHSSSIRHKGRFPSTEGYA